MYVESDTGTETKRFANVLRDMLGAASRWSQTFCATEELLTGLVWFGFCDQPGLGPASGSGLLMNCYTINFHLKISQHSTSLVPDLSDLSSPRKKCEPSQTLCATDRYNPYTLANVLRDGKSCVKRKAANALPTRWANRLQVVGINILRTLLRRIL